MSKSRDKMVPGARLFGSALASIRNPSQCIKPKPLGLKEVQNPGSNNLDSSSSPTSIREASIPVFHDHSSILSEETHNSLCVKGNESRGNEILLQPITTKENEFALPASQPRSPPGFHKPVNVYNPPNFQVYQSTASFDPTSAPMRNFIDPYCPFYASEASTSYSNHSSSFRDNHLTPINYSMPLPTLFTPQPSPLRNQENPFYLGTTCSFSTPISCEDGQQRLHALSATDFDPPCFFSSHEVMRQTLYSITAIDLALQINGSRPDSPSDCAFPLNSQDSGCLLSDNHDSCETSSDDALFTGMSYYHMANTPELSSAGKQIPDEVPTAEKKPEPKQAMSYYHMANTPELSSAGKQIPDEVATAEKKPEPKQAPDTLISSRVNRRNVNRIQGANTCISSGGKKHKTLHINRAHLPRSVAKYSSSEDSGADVSMDEDPTSSPSCTDCSGCETLSKRVSLADAQKQWKALPDYGRTQFLSLRCTPGFIDSHCHLDFLLGRQNYDGTYTEYMKKHRGTYPVSYEGCVAVFCHPDTFHKKGMWQKYLDENGVWGAFGCHPHHSKFYDSAAEHHLEQAIQNSKVRALGEIGLDYSNRNDCSMATQHRVFQRQLKIALDEHLPLVIHCRDANEDTMRIMKEILPRNYTIHLHCFTDGWDWAQKWLEEFPNLCIGITNLVTFPSAEETHDVVKKIPLDRLLLETDAPYFIPRKVTKASRNTKYSHPGMAIHVAAQIAALRGVSLKEIIYHTRRNTRKVYGI